MNPTLPLILASSSPRRRVLLSSLGLMFTTAGPDIDETQSVGEDPFAYNRRLSVEKAKAVAARLGAGALVIAADSIVVLDGVILGKPADADEARQMLRRLRGREHTGYTSICLYNSGLGRYTVKARKTEIVMRAFTDAEIEAYIETGDPFDKAGGYAIQHSEFRPAEVCNGCLTNVIGLPLCALREGLAEMGYPGITAPKADTCDCPLTMPTGLI